MKQLSIFSPTIPQYLELDLKKRIKKSSKSKKYMPGHGLWAHEAEEEKELALFFLDIRDFTPFVEKHHAKDVIYIIRKLFSSFQKIIRVHHGQIIETSGDGFYAAFGFDRDIIEAVNAAVKAGHAVLETLKTLNEESFEKKLNHKIDIGIGLHAGKVATGNILLEGKQHKIVMGYPVNIASRLQDATKELNNNFIVSSKVFDMLYSKPHLRNSVQTGASAQISLKGVSGLFQLHLMGRPYTNN